MNLYNAKKKFLDRGKSFKLFSKKKNRRMGIREKREKKKWPVTQNVYIK